MKLVFDFFPERRSLETPFDDFSQILPASRAVHPGSVGDVVKDRFGKWIRFLKHHPDPKPQLRHFHPQNAFAIQQHVPVYARAPDGFIHSIQCSQKRRLAATRGSDERRHFMRKNREADPVQRLKRSIEEIQTD